MILEHIFQVYLLFDVKLRASYFAIRAFWIETELRLGSTAYAPPNSTPTQHIQWWQCAIDHVLYPKTSTITSSRHLLRHKDHLRIILSFNYYNSYKIGIIYNGRNSITTIS
jgi:hypothetical protein